MLGKENDSLSSPQTSGWTEAYTPHFCAVAVTATVRKRKKLAIDLHCGDTVCEIGKLVYFCCHSCKI